MPEIPPIVEIKNLSVERDIPILSDVSWTVRPGENWVLLGANGSGKTSLLKAITGYLPESRGEIVINGEPDADWQELRERIGFVSASIAQRIEAGETALEIVISGKYAMINYWGPLRRVDRAAAHAVLEQIEATELAQRPWCLLSQGERQRILIGRALMAEHRLLLILDEPCAGLDPAARAHFLSFLDRFASDPASPSVILVTHHVEEITPAFSHALVLHQGCVLASGPKTHCLKSEILAKAFDASLRLTRKKNGIYALAIQQQPEPPSRPPTGSSTQI
jgi:iron complex transport system ATP-binding protein